MSYKNENFLNMILYGRNVTTITCILSMIRLVYISVVAGPQYHKLTNISQSTQIYTELLFKICLWWKV